MHLLYLYPEEWTGRRAREMHTDATCQALAEQGVDVTLVTAGGLSKSVSGAVHYVNLSRRFGPIKSAAIFRRRFQQWLRSQTRFDWAYIIHLKAAAMLRDKDGTPIPYVYEAHEIFSQTPQKKEAKQIKLYELERGVISGAAMRIATSAALAEALKIRFALAHDFEIVPNAGYIPLPSSVGSPHGPFVYAGSISDWKGLDLVIEAAREAGVPLKVVGGTAGEWRKLGRQIDTSGITWQPRVAPRALDKALAGARAGLIPTQPETPSGRYSCPMKLFDYARCGLPVISTALPSLESLNVGPWCTQVTEPTREAWVKALMSFRHEPDQGEAARAWAGEHTWAKRAEALVRAFARHTPRA
jgi:glycosyltransferase involved in cell wall biosynthesis